DRSEYLRLLALLDGLDGADDRAEQVRKRLEELRTALDPLWMALMNRGRTRRRGNQEKKTRAAAGGGRRRRREGLEAEIGAFLRQYARKTKNTPDPNDRVYSRKVEELVKRMRAEDLDRLMRGEEA